MGRGRLEFMGMSVTQFLVVGCIAIVLKEGKGRNSYVKTVFFTGTAMKRNAAKVK